MDESFPGRWNCKWAACGFGNVGTAFVPCGDAVLPAEAAPCLTFDRAAQPAPLWEVFGVPSQWSVAERERLAGYRMIGSDGAGNPLCVEQGTGAIVLLDHEVRFRTRQLVNSSVRQLAVCLLAYLGEREPDRFRAAALAIDLDAMAERSFWWHEAARLGT